MPWPALAELKQALGVTTEGRDDLLERALAAAVDQVIVDVGPDPDVELVPTPSMAEAALLLAVMVTKAPDAPYGIAAVFDTGGLRVAANHPTYQRLLVGQRLRFPIA